MSTRTNRSDRPRGTRYLGAAVAWGAVVCGVLAVPAPATAVPVGGDQVLCAVGQPCIDNLYQTGTTIVVEWKGDQEWDAYNVRWSRPGRAETQHAVAGGRRGSFRITTVNPGVTYTVKVQGCETHVLSSSTCSPLGGGVDHGPTEPAVRPGHLQAGLRLARGPHLRSRLRDAVHPDRDGGGEPARGIPSAAGRRGVRAQHLPAGLRLAGGVRRRRGVRDARLAQPGPRGQRRGIEPPGTGMTRGDRATGPCCGGPVNRAGGGPRRAAARVARGPRRRRSPSD